MSTALQLHTETMAEWQILRQQAEVLVKTKFLPKSIETPEQAMAIMLTGRELGIGPMAALNTINVIAGKPTISPQLMLALINRTDQLEDFSITDDGQTCKVTMKRRGRQPHVETFSMKDAAMMRTTEYVNGQKQNIALSEKYNWKQQPSVMRRWRAVAACARVVFPDVILGLYTPDEMGAHTDVETGEVMEAALEPAADEQGLVWPENEKRVLGVVKPIEAEPEPEPVRAIKFVGAQPTDAPKRPQASSRRHAVLAYAEDVLKWTPEQLIAEIDQRFKIAINPDNLNLALEMMPGAQLKELNQALKAEFENRNRTR